jgi:hypothetical protein
MALPPGKKWVIAEGESVEVTYDGRKDRHMWLRHAKTAADPFWVFQTDTGQTVYVENIVRITRTNLPDMIAPSEDHGR